MKLNIQPEVINLVSEALELIPLPEVQCPCPHCGLPVRYPVTCRQSQIEKLDNMIAAANKWARDSGMTDDIIASIRAQCAIGKAQQSVEGNRDEA